MQVQSNHIVNLTQHAIAAFQPCPAHLPAPKRATRQPVFRPIPI